MISTMKIVTNRLLRNNPLHHNSIIECFPSFGVAVWVATKKKGEGEIGNLYTYTREHQFEVVSSSISSRFAPLPSSLVSLSS